MMKFYVSIYYTIEDASRIETKVIDEKPNTCDLKIHSVTNSLRIFSDIRLIFFFFPNNFKI